MKREGDPRTRARRRFTLAMVLFGTVGLLRRHIDWPSSRVAGGRAVIGTVTLLLVYGIRRQRGRHAHAEESLAASLRRLRPDLGRILLSGLMLGLNWIFLFEAYQATSIAAATTVYYLAPILVLLLSPLLLRTRFRPFHALCGLLAAAGVVLISGPWRETVPDLHGLAWAAGAAVCYAALMLLNMTIDTEDSLLLTILQLGTAALALQPHILITGAYRIAASPRHNYPPLFILGILQTGIAYALYFKSYRDLSPQSVAMLSYLDPVVAVLLSVLVLREPMSLPMFAGIVLVLGSAFAAERRQAPDDP